MANVHWQETAEQLSDRLDAIIKESRAVKKQIREHNPAWDGQSFDWRTQDELFQRWHDLGVKWRYFTALYILKITESDYDPQFVYGFPGE